jgi:hypothetical protein
VSVRLGVSKDGVRYSMSVGMYIRRGMDSYGGAVVAVMNASLHGWTIYVHVHRLILKCMNNDK